VPKSATSDGDKAKVPAVPVGATLGFPRSDILSSDGIPYGTGKVLVHRMAVTDFSLQCLLY